MDDRSPRVPAAGTAAHARKPPPRAEVPPDPAMIGIVMEAVALAAGEIKPRSDQSPPLDRLEPAHRSVKDVLDVTNDDSNQPVGVETGGYTGPVHELADRGADASHEAPDPPAEDRDRDAFDLNNALIHQMFAVSLDLHAALSRIEHDADDRHVAGKIRQAIDGLDRAIDDLRNTIIGSGNHRTPKRPESRP
jgi:signal transduction histidine kinase